MKEFGFIVASCLRTHEHKLSLYECLNSIKHHHPSRQIVVVVDFTSTKEFVDDVIREYQDVIFENDTPHVPADMLLLYFFKEKHYFQKAILLQDSMSIVSPLDISKTSDLDYLWHFTNHRVHWHIIPEPNTEFNKRNSIVTHDNLVEYCINHFIQKDGFKQYCIETYPKKNNWSGCFGCLCIIEYTMLCTLDTKCSIIETMMQMKDNRLRRAIESIFPLACQYTLEQEIHTSFDGLYYDGFYHNKFLGKCISKKSFDRQ